MKLYLTLTNEDNETIDQWKINSEEKDEDINFSRLTYSDRDDITAVCFTLVPGRNEEYVFTDIGREIIKRARRIIHRS